MNKIKKSIITLGTTAMLGALIATPKVADANNNSELFDFANKERWLFRLRAINVDPDESSVTNIGGAITADNQIVPEFDITYFWTKNIATELILAVTPHDMGAVNTSLGNLDLGDVWLLPPTLNLQYHFNPEGKIRPYVGAGLNYTIFFDANPKDVATIKYDDNFGYSLQTGLDYEIDKNWAINADIKKVFLDTGASINGGAVTADVNLDPWIFGVGLAYRF